MIIYGWGDKEIKSYHDTLVECNHCGERSHEFTVFQKYFHLFWIPFFPIGRKKIACRCTACNDVNNEDRMSHYLSLTRTPVTLFSGLIIIGLILAFFSVQDFVNHSQNNSYFDNPKVGDVFVINKEMDGHEDAYHYAKVTEMDGDTIFVIESAFYYTGQRKYEMADDDYFVDNYQYYLLKSELAGYKESGFVNKIIRKYSSSSNFNKEFSVEEEDTEEV